MGQLVIDVLCEYIGLKSKIAVLFKCIKYSCAYLDPVLFPVQVGSVARRNISCFIGRPTVISLTSFVGRTQPTCMIGWVSGRVFLSTCVTSQGHLQTSIILNDIFMFQMVCIVFFFFLHIAHVLPLIKNCNFVVVVTRPPGERVANLKLCCCRLLHHLASMSGGSRVHSMAGQSQCSLSNLSDCGITSPWITLNYQLVCAGIVC